MIAEIAAKAIFRLRQHYRPLVMSNLRRFYWRTLGMRVDRGARMGRMTVTWPHRVELGERCSLEFGLYLNVAGSYSTGVAISIGEGTFVGSNCEFNAIELIEIGPNCLIASGSRFIDHNHGMDPGEPMKLQKELSQPIHVGADVWIGANCVLLKGVTIGEGAVIAAGSVVTRSIAPYAIAAGVPARVMRMRVPV